MIRLESIVTAECLKNKAVAEGLEREAKRKKICDMRNKITEIEKQIGEVSHTTEGLMLKTLYEFENGVHDEIQKNIPSANDVV
jgi:hypothetical protein